MLCMRTLAPYVFSLKEILLFCFFVFFLLRKLPRAVNSRSYQLTSFSIPWASVRLRLGGFLLGLLPSAGQGTCGRGRAAGLDFTLDSWAWRLRRLVLRSSSPAPRSLRSPFPSAATGPKSLPPRRPPPGARAAGGSFWLQLPPPAPPLRPLGASTPTTSATRSTSRLAFLGLTKSFLSVHV